MATPASIRAEMDHLSSEISRLETEVSQRNAELSRLKNQLRQLDDCLHASTTFPFDRLPAELLSEIFIHSTLSPVDHPRDAVEESDHIALLLTQICRHWRAVALQTPPLWAAIAFTLEGSGRGSTEAPTFRRSAEKLDVFAHRAGACLLNVDMTIGPDLLNVPAADLELFIHCFRRHAPKIHTLTVYGADEIALFGRRDDWEFSALTNLKLINTLGVRRLQPTAMFASAPSLRNLSIFEVPASEVDVPWSQIVAFHGRLQSLADFTYLLSVADNLLSVDISLTPDQRTRTTPHSELVHSSLQQLCLRERYDPDIDCLALEHFAFPALRKLDCYAEDSATEWRNYGADPDGAMPDVLPHAPLASFLAHSPLLNTLRLKTMWSWQSFTPLYKNTHNLTSLQITPALTLPMAETFFDELRVLQTQSTPALPHLSSIDLKLNAYATNNSAYAFARVLESAVKTVNWRRAQAEILPADAPNRPCAITFLKLVTTSYSEFSPTLLERFEALKQSGLDLFIGAAEGRIA
ncbi:F-box domain-containing protein [Mycena chlorophos]|uniref:F-box domain-containing protein n=1 Tax=Mycena chlorophos TaxID=658473 RepID=A0A8H6VUE2_MYCCL|nr:F-box domain-containing protein [Mycena chlorophos]